MKRVAGSVEYELTYKRVKNINLRVGSDGSVAVSAPYRTDAAYIDSFVTAHTGFILSAQRKRADCCPLGEPMAAREAVYAKLYSVYRSMYGRFSEYGFRLPTLRIRSMTSQWGNCRKAQRIITLNTRLYSLPQRLIELVAAHELSHMVYADHSPRFYSVLSGVMPDYDQRERELKKYRLSK